MKASIFDKLTYIFYIFIIISCIIYVQREIHRNSVEQLKIRNRKLYEEDLKYRKQEEEEAIKRLIVVLEKELKESGGE